LGIAQFIPHKWQAVEVNLSKVFTTKNTEVDAILRKACYDCHSNETEYPWYGDVVPVFFFLQNHIQEGRERLNFSVWKNYPPADQKQLEKDIVKVVQEKEMPMLTYWIIHWEAKITEEERKALVAYFEQK